MPRALPAALIALTLGAAPAWAGPAEDADAREALAAAGLADATFASATREGGDIVVSGIVAKVQPKAARKPPRPAEAGKPEKPEKPETARIASLRAQGARGEGKARSYDKVTLSGMDVGDVHVDVTVATGVLAAGFDGNPGADVVQARGVSTRMAGGESLRVEGIHLSRTGWRGPGAESGSLQIRGVSVKGGRADLLAAMPDLPRTADLDIGWSSNPDTGRAALDGLTLWLGKAATLRMTASFTGFDAKRMAEAGAANAAAMSSGEESSRKVAEAMQGVRLEDATVRVENAGLVQSLVTIYALTQGTDTVSVTANLTKAVEGMWPRGKGDLELRANALRAVKAFLADPRSLDVRVAPPGGLDQAGFSEAMKAGPNARALGLTVEANTPRRTGEAKAQ